MNYDNNLNVKLVRHLHVLVLTVELKVVDSEVIIVVIVVGDTPIITNNKSKLC